MKYFAYCRKSSEDEHRQVLSIPSQIQELKQRFADDPDIEIVEFLDEKRSAMKPGRPIFGALIERIERGEAQGIIAWAPDRIARNSIDGGRVVYLLDLGIIKDLKFATYTFENNSQGKFMLQIMFGQSKYYSDALSENVKRGVRTKIENGWWPTIAPLGYRNNRDTREIDIDPERFALIRRMFDMLLSGAYSAEQIRQAALDWGLRTPQRRKLGGKPLALSTVYKIFYNPFYAGIIQWSGKWSPGKHKPILSLAEHERVKAILRRPGRPQPQRHTFAYTGLMRCGSCGLMITAENKTNRFGSHYTYYHCSWRARPKCPERSVEVGNLEAQFLQVLRNISISDRVHQWAIEKLEAEKAVLTEHSSSERRAITVAIAAVERRSEQLTDMRARSLIDDTEFVENRETAQRELLRLKQSLADFEAKKADWFEPAKAVLSFSNRTVVWFREGTDEEKRLIVHSVGSNLWLCRRIANVQARKIYRYVPKKTAIPTWCAFKNNIRKMVGKVELEETLSAIRKLEGLRALRGVGIRSPQSHSAAASPASRIDRAGARPLRAPPPQKVPHHIPRDRAA